MAQLIKAFLVPGSISFLIAGLALALALLYGSERSKRWGRAWLTVLLLGYALLATPIGADWIAAPLVRTFKPITSAEQARGIDTVVVLSVGADVYRAAGREIGLMRRNTAYNALEAARLNALVAPRTIIASGGIVDPQAQTLPESEILASGLVSLGIPRERIVVESRSRTTREQAENCAKLLEARQTRRFLLVTGPDHMPRASSTFRELGLDPLPSVSVFAIDTPPGAWYRLRPSLAALRQSELACYEYLARLYYWKKGWL